MEAKESEEQSPDISAKRIAGRSPGMRGQPIPRRTPDPFGKPLQHQPVAEQTDDSGEDKSQSGEGKELPQLVQVDVNLDTLRGFLEEIQETIGEHARSIQLMQSDLQRKANEKTVGYYMQKVSECLYKECGERPHAVRLETESAFLQENYQTDDSTQLKRQAEKLMEKMEIIGLNIINFHKFRNETNERLERVEKQLPKCYTTEQFREEA